MQTNPRWSYDLALGRGKSLHRDAGQWLRAVLLEDKDQVARDVLLNDRQRAGATFPDVTGGALVPDQIESEIIALRDVAGVFRAHARQRPMGSDSLTAPRRRGGLTAYFIGEGAALTESAASWDNVGFTAKKLGVLTRVSTELDEDSAPDLGAYFIDDIGFAFASKEDDCGFNGDGTSNYGGIRGICPILLDGSHGAGKIVAASGHDLATELDASDLAALLAALPEYALPNASWYCSSYTFANCFGRLGMVAGASVTTAWGLRPSFSYGGFPIVPTPKLPGAGSQTGKCMILLGDLNLAASVGARRGMTVMQSNHHYLELDQIGIRGTERVDIVVHDLGDNTNAGPFVGLEGN